MTRLIFVTAFDYPSRYAHAIHGLHMARAFHKALGDHFLFVINTDVNGTLASIPQYRLFGRVGRRVKKLHLRRVLLPFSLALFFMRNPTWRESTLLVNDPQLIAAAVLLKRLFGVRIIFESHGLLTLRQAHLLAGVASRVLFTTKLLAEDAYVKQSSLQAKAVVVPNAVDVEAFTREEGSANLRRELALPEGTLVGYVGRFEPTGADKGVAFLIDAVPELPPEAHLVLVGGSKAEIARYSAYVAERGLSPRVTLVPHVAPDLVPRYVKACDILVYVPEGKSAFYEKETSPMKLYEYMAAKRPIIVSDLPTTREAIPEGAALFIEPGSRSAFVAAIKETIAKPDEAARRARHARDVVGVNSWDARAKLIISLMTDRHG